MTNHDPAGNPASGGDYYAPAEDVRYDLNGNPLPPTPGISPSYAPPTQIPPSGPGQPPAGPFQVGQPASPYGAPPVQPMPPAPPPYAAGPGAHPGYGGSQMPGVIPPNRGASTYGSPPQTPYADAPTSPTPYAGPPYGPVGYGGPQMPGGIPPTQGLPPLANYPAMGAPYSGRPIGASPTNPVGWYIAVAVGFIALVTVVFMSRVSKPEHIAAPLAYEHVESGDKAFACDGPGGWDLSVDGSPGMDGGVHFANGPVKINVVDSTGLSFLGETMKVPGFGGDSGSEAPPPPVEEMHQKTEKDVADNFPGYTEMPEQKVQVQYGDTRVSEWTSTGGWFTGKQHGYRATIMGLDKVITVVCHCPETDWTTMQPVFMKVIQSIEPEAAQ